MYTYNTTITPNGITRIEVYKDGESVKIIRNSIPSKAHEQLNYYLSMMTGINNYIAWLQKGK